MLLQPQAQHSAFSTTATVWVHPVKMAMTCYLLVAGEIDETVPTRVWGSVRDARAMQLGEVLDAAELIITDDPSLIDTAGPSLVFRPDAGAGRYLLPNLPDGYDVVETTADLIDAVHAVLAANR